MGIDLTKATQQQFNLAINELRCPVRYVRPKNHVNLADRCIRTIASSGNDQLESEMAATLAPFKCRELSLEVEALTEVKLWEMTARKLAILNVTCREPQLDYDTLKDCKFWQGTAIERVECMLGEFFASDRVNVEVQSITEIFANLVHICNLLVLCNSQEGTLLEGFEEQVAKFRLQCRSAPSQMPKKVIGQIAKLTEQLLDDDGSSHSSTILEAITSLTV